MSQLLPTDNTVLNFRSVIATLLNDELGTFSGGVKAIWIEPPSAPSTANGLMAVISRYSRQFSPDLYQWKLTLIQFDKSDQGVAALDRAINKVRRRFPSQRRDSILDYRDESYPQASFSIGFSRIAYPNLR